MRGIIRSVLAVLAGVLAGGVTYLPGQGAAEAIFELGALEVLGEADLPADARVEWLPSGTIQLLERPTLAGALDAVTGVTLNSVAGRNELGVYVRGFDLRQVPLFIDGIPVYVPYDGYVDLGRFTTFDVGGIAVAKGFSSVLAGPNALGGTINLVSRRPERPLEIEVRAGIFSGEGREFALNAGGRRDRWYWQAALSHFAQDYFEVADGFGAFTAAEDGGRRENSYREDQKVSLKVGYTPNDTDEYALGFSHQAGEKGTPPYTGADAATRPRFWRWPQWDKSSVFFVSSTRLGEHAYVKPRIFYDTFDNQLFSYDDATYTAQTRPSSFRSIYDDYTWGTSIEVGTAAFAAHTLKAAAHYKYDVHREHNVGSPETSFRDRTWSLSVEDTLRLSERTAVVGGLAYEGRQSVQAQNLTGTVITDFPGNHNDSFNPQLGVFFRVAPEATVEATVARKSRFPTVKDRYSYRLGQAIPNPALVPEHALHYELAYRQQLRAGFSWRTSVFVSRIDDAIQRVDRVAFAGNGSPLFQLRNVGESEHRGFEIGADLVSGERFSAGASYSYLRRKNLTSPAVRLIDTPEHKVFAYASIALTTALTLTTSLEGNSSRFSTSTGVEVSGYMLAGAKLAWRLAQGLTAAVGVNNAFDKNYQLTEGYPEEGRAFFANVVLKY